MLPLVRRLSVALLALALLGAAPPRDALDRYGAPLRSISYPIRTMGTYAQVVLVAGDSSAAAPVAGRALRVFARVDSLMSNWTATSEVARINREAFPNAVTVEPEVATVIDTSLRVWRASDGAFDITVEPLIRAWGFLGGKPHVPAEADVAAAFARVGGRYLDFDAASRTLRFAKPGVQIDLGGIAKGYAVDAAAAALQGAGVDDALVDLSGNMRALGHPANATTWRIGVRDPRDRIPYFARLQLVPGEGISTSGKYEQYVEAGGKTFGHILDPRTGTPSEGLIGVTVVAKCALDADSWDTPLFVLGPEAAKRTALARNDIDVILVQPGTSGRDTVWVEHTLANRMMIEPSATRWFTVVPF